MSRRPRRGGADGEAGGGLFGPDAARLRAESPLPARMRPATLEGFVGQERVIGPGTALREAILNDRLGSYVLWGPPGSGKTTLARIVANTTQAHFVQLSAVSAGVAAVRETIAEAKRRRLAGGQRTILFLDEIHRFNKAQQDALLPAVEDGTIYLIGATTENPYFEVNSALVSRCRVFRLEPLAEADLRQLVGRALTDTQHGLARHRAELSEEALAHLLIAANGDARSALSTLEIAVALTPAEPDGRRLVSKEAVTGAVGQRALRYDRAGDAHYDAASAFIKSMRGSDPDAAVYWLATMIEAGEDPVFIARRIVICASEDVGNADPRALQVAVAAAWAATLIGPPEARIPLSQAAIYVACAPKSNASCAAIDAAGQDVRRRKAASVPPHLRNAPHPGMAAHGFGVEYKYPHDHPGGVVAQQHLPSHLAGATYYHPADLGEEAEIRRRLERLRRLTRAQPDDSIPSEDKD